MLTQGRVAHRTNEEDFNAKDKKLNFMVNYR